MALPRETPAAVGLDPERLAIADAHVRAGLEAGIYPAAVLAVARHGKLVHCSPFGSIESGPVVENTIFDLASLTKPVVAATLLALIEDGKLSLNQNVADFVVEARGAAMANLPLRSLATHTSGLPAWRPLYKATERRGQVMAELMRAQPEASPGARYVYSDLGYIALGLVAARAAGGSLADYMRERLLSPLGMTDTCYTPPSELAPRVAPTANCQFRPGKTLVGQVHDANAFVLGGCSGHAGLFGTAPDLAVFATAILGLPTGGSTAPLGRPALRLAQTDQIPTDIGGHSIGWFTPPNPMLPAGDLLSKRAFGHTGFTGTMIVCDPEFGLAVVLLTNRVMNPADNGGVRRVRTQVVHAVASAIRA